MRLELDGWCETLSEILVKALEEARPRVSDELLSMVALDCHPWHGHPSIAMLTAAEVRSQPSLADPAQMAGWKHFNLTASLRAWERTDTLCEQMKRGTGSYSCSL